MECRHYFIINSFMKIFWVEEQKLPVIFSNRSLKLSTSLSWRMMGFMDSFKRSGMFCYAAKESLETLKWLETYPTIVTKLDLIEGQRSGKIVPHCCPNRKNRLLIKSVDINNMSTKFISNNSNSQHHTIY